MTIHFLKSIARLTAGASIEERSLIGMEDVGHEQTKQFASVRRGGRC
jgi:hypothetical protein